MSTTWRIAVLVVLAVVMVAGSVAVAHAAAASSPATRSATGTGTVGASGYDMSLTLPSYGKSGCMVCHGDPNLVRIKNGKIVSYYMSQKAIDHSAHAKVACTACHSDFAFTLPHKPNGNWQETAKSSCRSCHPREWDAWVASVHGPTTTPGKKYTGPPKPSCGDCHGGHYIGDYDKDPAAKAALHASAGKICGDCHQDYWKNYDDYYHGAAYRKGAQDAPACWDCHGAHAVLPSSNPDSPTNKDNLPKTCSKCHQGTSETYTQYATIIHKKDSLLAANPVYAVVKQTTTTIGDAFASFVQQLRAAFSPQPAKAASPQ